MLQVQRALVMHLTFGQVSKSTVIVHVTVLIHFDEGRTLVGSSPLDSSNEMLCICIDSARYKRRLSANRHTERIEGMIGDTQGSRFDPLLSEFRGRGILSFVKPVDAVVKEHDLHIHIAPQDMQQVIAPNTESITITRDHPYHEIGPARLEPCGNGGRTAMNGVEAICMHIVWEAAGTPNARDKDYFLPWHP